RHAFPSYRRDGVDMSRTVSGTDLQQQLWPDTSVAEANLSNLIAEIRDALGDRRAAAKWIRTAHGLGCVFSGQATTLSPRRVFQEMCRIVGQAPSGDSCFCRTSKMRSGRRGKPKRSSP